MFLFNASVAAAILHNIDTIKTNIGKNTKVSSHSIGFCLSVGARWIEDFWT